MKEIISVYKLSKTYKNGIKALDQISFTANEKTIFGIIGPDGAGKTTLLRCLCGLFHKFDGDIRIFGKDLANQKKEIQKNIGYLSQRFSLYGDLSVEENINFFARIRGISNYEGLKSELISKMSLSPFLNRPAKYLSGGMKQKLSLICSLIHRPNLLILDEPTAGVDPVSRRELWDIIQDAKNEGTTIVYSTSYLDEAERCDFILFLKEGKEFFKGKVEDIVAQERFCVIEIYSSRIREINKILSKRFIAQLFGDRLNVLTKFPEEDLKIIEQELKSRKIIFESDIVSHNLENAFLYKTSELSNESDRSD